MRKPISDHDIGFLVQKIKNIKNFPILFSGSAVIPVVGCKETGDGHALSGKRDHVWEAAWTGIFYWSEK